MRAESVLVAFARSKTAFVLDVCAESLLNHGLWIKTVLIVDCKLEDIESVLGYTLQLTNCRSKIINDRFPIVDCTLYTITEYLDYIGDYISY